jgi:Flp pilus assembly pilin Flp
MRKIWNALKRLHRDEGGAEGLEKLLIIAVVVLPLLIALVWFRDDIGQWVSDLWNSLKGQAQQPVPTP